MKVLAARHWYRQAESDFAASKKLSGCHERYLLQQAYEKGVKGLGVARLGRAELKDKQFLSALGSYFLHHHTPMTVLSSSNDGDVEGELKKAYPRDWREVRSKLAKFRESLKLGMQAEADDATVRAWRKIDDTRPSKDPTLVSYRYPFIVDSKTRLQ